MCQEYNPDAGYLRSKQEANNKSHVDFSAGLLALSTSPADNRRHLGCGAMARPADTHASRNTRPFAVGASAQHRCGVMGNEIATCLFKRIAIQVQNTR